MFKHGIDYFLPNKGASASVGWSRNRDGTVVQRASIPNFKNLESLEQFLCEMYGERAGFETSINQAQTVLSLSVGQGVSYVLNFENSTHETVNIPPDVWRDPCKVLEKIDAIITPESRYDSTNQNKAVETINPINFDGFVSTVHRLIQTKFQNEDISYGYSTEGSFLIGLNNKPSLLFVSSPNAPLGTYWENFVDNVTGQVNIELLLACLEHHLGVK